MTDRVFGLILIVFGLLGIWQAWDLVPPFEYEPVGPRAFPVLICALLALCGMALVLSKPQSIIWPPREQLVKVGAFFLVILLYGLLFNRLGFVISTIVLFIPVALFFGATVKQAVGSALLSAFGLFLLFDKLLDVVLPSGTWLKPLLGT